MQACCSRPVTPPPHPTQPTHPPTLSPRCACCSAGEGALGSSSGGLTAGAAGRGPSSSSLVAEDELPPSQRELDNLREWLLTQQWLRQQALVGGEVPGGGNPAAAAQHLQAMQQLWEQGGRG